MVCLELEHAPHSPNCSHLVTLALWVLYLVQWSILCEILQNLQLRFLENSSLEAVKTLVLGIKTFLPACSTNLSLALSNLLELLL